MNPMDLLQNIQNLQGRMSELQEQLKTVSAEGSSGGGMVKMKINGNLQVTSVSITPEAVDPDDLQMLEDLVLAAANSALREVQESMKSKASELYGGMPIPGFPGFGQ